MSDDRTKPQSANSERQFKQPLDETVDSKGRLAESPSDLFAGNTNSFSVNEDVAFSEMGSSPIGEQIGPYKILEELGEGGIQYSGFASR